MANLKTNLDEYLLQNDSRRGFRWGIPEGWRPNWGSAGSSSASTPTVTTSNESNSWFSQIKCDCIPTLTRTQRLIGFCTCVGLGLLCFILSFIFIPVLLLKARKFALLFTFGSCFFIMSASFLYGPINHIKSLFSKEKIVATLLYWGTLIMTLVSALHFQSTILTIIFAILQIIVLVWITLGVVPGGTTGMRAFGNMFKSSVSHTLPI